MKSTRFCTTAILATLVTANAYAYSPLIFANGISARNIGAMQHSIILNTMESFEGSAASALGPRGRLVGSAHHRAHDEYIKYDNPATYGDVHKMYGEYGDDNMTLGRSGGDTPHHHHHGKIPPMNNIWIGWQHYGDNVKPDNFGTLDSQSDLIMMGLSTRRAQIRHGVSEWGMFGGYAGGTQENDAIEMHENGGYVGVYNGYNIHRFGVALALNAGALYNRAQESVAEISDEYANMWIGAATQLKYNIRLTDAFTLQPGVYGGYTWIHAADYMSAMGTRIDNANLNIFEIAPALRAIAHIGRGWYGTLDVRYAFNFLDGNKSFAGDVAIPDLGHQNFIEYGIGIEKSIDRFNVSINFGRHDVGRRGWNGGFSLKYRF